MAPLIALQDEALEHWSCQQQHGHRARPRALSMPSARMASATPSSGVDSTSGSPCAGKASLNTADEYSLPPAAGALAWGGQAHSQDSISKAEQCRTRTDCLV